jgi:hypothetical protein
MHEDNIKMDLGEMDCDGVHCTEVTDILTDDHLPSSPSIS